MNESNTKQANWKKIGINLVAIILCGFFLIWISTYFLDFWTHHGSEVEVPDVKGLMLDNAIQRLESEGYEVVLQDSVYEDVVPRGSVVEQNPKCGAKVKPGRTIYLTINAVSPRTVMVPALTDISVRQARTILEGLGIKNITIKEIPSDYKDLVYSATADGVKLVSGMRIPLTAAVCLEVGAGYADENQVAADTISSEAELMPEIMLNSVTSSADDDSPFFD